VEATWCDESKQEVYGSLAAQDKGVQAPDPVPEVANKSAPNPAAKKPQRTKPVVQPTPTPAPTWQDDALDKLDDLEKRL